MNTLAVIVVNYATPDLTIRCIDAIDAARADLPDLRLVVVDGASPDDSVARIGGAIAARQQGEWVTLLPLAVNGGFGFANNHGIAELARASDLPHAIALINPDAFVTPGALAAMLAVLAREQRAGAVGGLLIHEDGRPQSSAFRFPTLASEFCAGARTAALERLLRVPPSRIDLNEMGEVPWVTGAAVLFRTAALRDVGLFDEGFFLYYEETELMWRLRRGGWSIWHEPAARIVHAGGAATNIRDPETGLPRRERLPGYWYDSRRRFVTLTRGRLYGLAFNLAWVAGRAFWKLRQRAAPRPETGALRATRDVISHGLWPTRRDATPAVAQFDASPNATPRWMG